LKKEEMLKRINSAYNPNLTLETVVERVQFLRKLKYPFIAVILVGYLMQITRELYRAYAPVAFDFEYIWFAYNAVIWLATAIGFFTYGRKLTQIMPDEIKEKMKTVRCNSLHIH
jgi:hypothetical protein